VAHFFNPNYSRSTDPEDCGLRPVWGKVSKTSNSANPGYSGVVNKRSAVQPGLGKNARPYSKNN
jgi:hypothetical protein